MQRSTHCEKCDKSYTNYKQYRRHLLTIHVDKSIKPFSCDQCTFSTHAKRYLADHRRYHHTENQYQTKTQEYTCKACSQIFDTSKRYVLHYKKSHFDIPPDFKDKMTFICAYCPEVFLGKKTLQIHTRKHHGSGTAMLKQYNCTTCQLTFTGKQNFVSHCKEVHNNIVPILQGNLLRGIVYWLGAAWSVD